MKGIWNRVQCYEKVPRNASLFESLLQKSNVMESVARYSFRYAGSTHA